MAILYEIINKFNGLKYIGATTTKLSSRWNCHLYRFRKNKASFKIQNDYNNYGKDCFIIKELEFGEKDYIFNREKELSKDYIQYGYNCVSGGIGADVMKERYDIHRNKLKNDDNYRKNFCKKVSKGLIGRKHSEDTIRKISISHKGIKWSDSRKNERSVKYSGENNPNHGNYSIYLNIETGIYYETPELYNYFGKTKSGINWLKKIGNYEISKFVKV